MKVYDPSNEFDEEYFEFGLFMSRREYKTINRRLVRGRDSSAAEGKYISSIAPYGYRRVKLPNEKGFTLEPHPDEAPVIQKIYSMFLNYAGTKVIANTLNDQHIPTRHGGLWTYSTITNIITNPIYMGKIRRGWSKQVKSFENGQVKKRIKRQKNAEDYQIYEGLHPALVTEEDFMRTQAIRMERQPCAKVKDKCVLQNAFAGLLFCSVCGNRIGRTTQASSRDGPPRLRCVNGRNCHNSSANYDVVEQEIIAALRIWLDGYRVKIDTAGFAEDIAQQKALLDQCDQELEKLNRQMENAFDLVEQGIYTLDLFKERRAKLEKAITDIKKRRAAISMSLQKLEAGGTSQSELIPQTEKLLESYADMTCQERNDMLKTILKKIEYQKGADGEIQIDLYPRLPHL